MAEHKLSRPTDRDRSDWHRGQRRSCTYFLLVFAESLENLHSQIFNDQNTPPPAPHRDPSHTSLDQSRQAL